MDLRRSSTTGWTRIFGDRSPGKQSCHSRAIFLWSIRFISIKASLKRMRNSRTLFDSTNTLVGTKYRRSSAQSQIGPFCNLHRERGHKFGKIDTLQSVVLQTNKCCVPKLPVDGKSSMAAIRRPESGRDFVLAPDRPFNSLGLYRKVRRDPIDEALAYNGRRITPNARREQSSPVYELVSRNCELSGAEKRRTYAASEGTSLRKIENHAARKSVGAVRKVADKMRGEY